LVAKAHLGRAAPRYLLINSGNANAGTGDAGREDALSTCRAVAALGGCETEAVLPFSTGVIGEPLPTALIVGTLPRAFATLTEDGWEAAGRAIMTTDTVPKIRSRSISVAGQSITVTGIAKGAGMIEPNMATLLSFLATDAAMSPAAVTRSLQRAIDASFNRITVDGDTSTNDACVLIATARSKLPRIEIDIPVCQALETLVRDVCIELAQAIVRDGEGATKFITIEVRGGQSGAECHRVARAVANSPLVKTAFFASDPNWGRILAAVGRAGVVNLDIGRVAISLDEVRVVHGGARANDYTEARGREVMRRKAITVAIDLGLGTASDTMWTCDLSYDYVRINAEYRT
jgi:glutamate N-acetyltransferase/amino-acid N-acetyltransferase